MSTSNLAKALHDELCEAFDCRYQMPDLDTGVPTRVTQYGHQYPREFWEGMAVQIVDERSLLAAHKVVYDLTERRTV